MFNNQKKAAVKQVKKEQSKDYAVTILTNGCHFSGKMYCRGSTRVGGRVEGEIISEGLLILEEEAVVDAKITCEEIVLQGKITGTIKAKTRVEMSCTCTFTGDVVSPSLVIEEGAHFSGRSTMKDEIDVDTNYQAVKLSSEDDDRPHPKIEELRGANGALPEVNIKSREMGAEV